MIEKLNFSIEFNEKENLVYMTQRDAENIIKVINLLSSKINELIDKYESEA